MGNMKTLRVGMIGSGFMGKCHANAFRTYNGLFNGPIDIVLYKLADINEELAEQNARALGFEQYTGDWRLLIDDERVDIVSITAPNALHEEIALAAIEKGKIVYCEKPLSTDSESALRMTMAAEAAGIVTQVGFNFLRNPLLAVCKDILGSGEIGEIVSFRGRHAENYMVNPDLPHSFRTDIRGGGALADIGSHIVSMSRYLLGDITEVAAQISTVHKMRPVSSGSSEYAPVEVDDVGQALVHFEKGIPGTIEANWMATGRTMDLSFEVTGTKGAISFSQERMNELLIWDSGTQAGREGFKRVETGPAHPPYANFCPAAGHHLGFNDLKVIEVAELIESIVSNKPTFTNFREGYKVQNTIDTILRAARSHTWEAVDHGKLNN